MAIHIREANSGKPIEGTSDRDILVWDTALKLWRVTTPENLLPKITVAIDPSYSGGNPSVKWSQAGSSGSVTTSVIVPVASRSVYQSGDVDAFTLAAVDTGPITVDLEWGPLGYAVLDVTLQIGWNTTHNNANPVNFGCAGIGGGSHPRLPFRQRCAAVPFTQTSLGEFLVPKPPANNNIWPIYYGPDAIANTALQGTAFMLIIRDTGKRF